MFEFFKNKKPKITWWSSIKHLEKITPVVPADKYIPQWFKQVKKNYSKSHSNVKLCPSYLKYFSLGWVMPLWCDVELSINNEGLIIWRTPNIDFQFEFHDDYQYKDLVPKNEQDSIACVLKPVSPWLVKISKGWSLLQLPMSYEFNPDWQVLSGVLPASSWPQTNHQIIIRKSFFDNKQKKNVILKGAPLAQYIPVPDNYISEVVEETEELKEHDNTSRLIVQQKFTNRFKNLKECPYANK
jgi:hypothetical protein